MQSLHRVGVAGTRTAVVGSHPGENVMNLADNETFHFLVDLRAEIRSSKIALDESSPADLCNYRVRHADYLDLEATGRVVRDMLTEQGRSAEILDEAIEVDFKLVPGVQDRLIELRDIINRTAYAAKAGDIMR